MEKAGNILAIDDEESFTSFIKLNLQTETRYDVKVTTANSRVEGLKLARTIRPDLILLDIMMPDLSVSRSRCAPLRKKSVNLLREFSDMLTPS